MSFEIPFIRPVFPDPSEIAQDFSDIVRSNWYTNFGPQEREFSRDLEAYVGRDLHAITFNNATTALIAALTCRLGRGDGSAHVLIPSFTFAAGAEAIEWAGYRPLFVDIDRSSLQPSIVEASDLLEQGDRVIAGILLCNTFGISNANLGKWELLAEQYGVPLIVDSAAGFGSTDVLGVPLGGGGDCEIFSFHATKPFAVGEGGVAFTRDPELAESLRSFQNFGFRGVLGSTSPGMNGKLQEINAAIGRRQLRAFRETIDLRQAVLARYVAGLDPVHFVFPTGIEHSSVCFASVMLDNRELRDTALAALKENGVEARAYYSPALHRQPQFESVPRSSALAITEEVGSRIVSLPVHTRMTDPEVDSVISVLSRKRARQ